MKYKYVMFNSYDSRVSNDRKTWERFSYVDGPIRVMAEADGYAMVRRKGAFPFVISSKDIIKDPTP